MAALYSRFAVENAGSPAFGSRPLRVLQGVAASETAAIDAATQALQITLDRYRGGLVSYLDVVYAQTALLANQRALTQVAGQRMTATVVLIRALGGGWG